MLRGETSPSGAARGRLKMTDRTGNVALGPRSPRFPSSKFSVPTAASHLVPRSRLLDVLD